MHHSQLIQLQHAYLRAQKASEYHPPNAPTTKGMPTKLLKKLIPTNIIQGNFALQRVLGWSSSSAFSSSPSWASSCMANWGFSSFFLLISFIAILVIRSTAEIISCCVSSTCKPAQYHKKAQTEYKNSPGLFNCFFKKTYPIPTFPYSPAYES
jgi:hypothetical protein